MEGEFLLNGAEPPLSFIQQIFIRCLASVAGSGDKTVAKAALSVAYSLAGQRHSNESVADN